MKPILGILLVKIFVLALSPPVFAENPGTTKPLKLDFLQLNKDFPSGCGCSVTDTKGNFLVFSEGNLKAPVFVKVNGEKLSLPPQRPTETENSQPKVGDKSKERYSDGKTTLMIFRTVARVCKPGDESCEVINYKVNLELRRGEQVVKMENLNGDCGC